ncbi:hypothetical protein V1512DRAFT_270693 [Lipomyces arxii]|uniref:uncharacterized protein n=1 Tax=Lipomyces arxii TaxID=56418 RepID=UPI0034CDFF30
MKISTLFANLLCASSVIAYKVHNVTVGIDGFSFSPNSIKAAVGDYVQFEVQQSIHGIAQASFAQPCMPYANSDEGNGTPGFFSGILTYVDHVETFTIRVNTTDPMFFYCPEAYHCESGMVGAINPTDKQTIEAFLNAATQQSTNTAPAMVWGNTTIGDAAGLNGTSPSSSSAAVSSFTKVSSSVASSATLSATSPATTSATSTLITNMIAASSSAPAATSTSSNPGAINAVYTKLMLSLVVVGAYVLV